MGQHKSNITVTNSVIKKNFFFKTEKQEVNFYFIDKDDQKIEVKANKGDTVLHVAQSNGLDVLGTCESSLACCTCHVILDEKLYDKLEPADLDEDDLLDTSSQVQPTSRLGCQVKINEDFEDMEIVLP